MLRLGARRRKRMKEAAIHTAESFSVEVCVSKALKVYAQVRRRKPRLLRYQRSPWRSLMSRVKTELSMITNVSKATGAAILETATSR